MSKFDELADLIFPDIQQSIEDLEKKYPDRKNLLSGSEEVTRFAPSPTGFLHTGSLFTALISCLIARRTNGIFYFRLEDTDHKREIKDSGLFLLKNLKKFNIVPDEGKDAFDGQYGPYCQSLRADIYKIVIKELIKQQKAYPCFCSEKDLEEIRQIQKASKQISGYYGSYAKCRYLSVEEMLTKIKNHEKFVIRFKSNGNHNKKIVIHDEIRGDINIAENDLDVVILKSDGLPTYHFAHVVDDHFMKTTVVTRGEEWISSLPIHVEMFNALNWKIPKYVHLPLINKIDNGNKRKLSKRKDPESSVDFFFKEGYPIEAVIIYLMSIANSNFEQWLSENQNFNFLEFPFSIYKINLDGALFDLNKLNYFSKNFLSSLEVNDIAKRIFAYANIYDQKLASLIKQDFSYFVQILNIERDKKNPRKDYVKYADVYGMINFFYYDEYLKIVNEQKLLLSLNFEKKIIMEILSDFMTSNDYSLNEKDWFDSIKQLSLRHKFASSNKEYKEDLNNKFLGSVVDVANMIRIAITGKKNSPNLYCILHILNKDDLKKRIEYSIQMLNNNL